MEKNSCGAGQEILNLDDMLDLEPGKVFTEKRPQLSFYFSLLLISGDISSNPSPFEVDMFKDFREQMKGPGIKLCHINARVLLSKLTEVTSLV